MTINDTPAALIVPLGAHRPSIADTAWIAPHATIVGDVTIDDEASIWYGVAIRAEAEPIHLGRGSNIQDNSVVHTDPEAPAFIGVNVSIGHGAIVHGCTIEDGALIGMGAVVMNGAVVGAGSLLAAGTVVTQGTVIPAGSLVAGGPAAVKRSLNPAAIEANLDNARHYIELARTHRGAIANR